MLEFKLKYKADSYIRLFLFISLVKMMITTLENKYKLNRSSFDDDFRLRIHRAISWLKKAEKDPDADSQFISLWIAFNAAYANQIGSESGIEKATFINFIKEIRKLDQRKLLEQRIYNDLSEHISNLLLNRYAFQLFWLDLRGDVPIDWQAAMDKQNEITIEAIRKKNILRILISTFERLYTLRNQLFHGGSTYNSSANREQLKAACSILMSLIPVIIEIMLDNADEPNWGKPFYPFVKDEKYIQEQHETKQAEPFVSNEEREEMNLSSQLGMFEKIKQLWKKLVN